METAKNFHLKSFMACSLILYAENLKCVNVTGGRIDYLRAAEHFIVKYRAGKLGRMTLDSITDINHIT